MAKKNTIRWNLPRNISFSVPAEELTARIKKVQSFLDSHSLLVVFSHIPAQSYDNLYFRFRQNTDFYYLTGLEIHPAVLLVFPEDCILFYDEPLQEDEIWVGIKPNHKEIKAYLPFLTSIFPYKDFKAKFQSFLENKYTIYYPFGQNRDLDHYVFESLENKIRKGRSYSYFPARIHHAYEILFQLRQQKSQFEIRELEKVMEITKQAFLKVLKNLKHIHHENEIEAILLETYKSHNAYPAYPPIVAGGANACILHYQQNNQKIPEGSLVLIDSAAGKNYINTDITRTLPSGGKFSRIQKLIYDVVLQAQEKAIEKARTGYCMEDVHYAALLVMIDFLKQEKILKEPVDVILEKELYKPFFMHRTGHWLGYDVHDKGFYLVPPIMDEDKICKSNFHRNFPSTIQNLPFRKLEPGMVFTVEPGLYFSPGLKGIPNEWKGIGIRIEDNVLITESDPVILSREIPKTTEEIEFFMNS